MKNKTCPFQDWVLTQGTNSAENEHDETDPRTCPDWLRMSINKTDAHPQVPASTRTGRVMIARSPSQVSGAYYKHKTVIMKKKFTLPYPGQVMGKCRCPHGLRQRDLELLTFKSIML